MPHNRFLSSKPLPSSLRLSWQNVFPVFLSRKRKHTPTGNTSIHTVTHTHRSDIVERHSGGSRFYPASSLCFLTPGTRTYGETPPTVMWSSCFTACRAVVKPRGRHLPALKSLQEVSHAHVAPSCRCPVLKAVKVNDSFKGVPAFTERCGLYSCACLLCKAVVGKQEVHHLASWKENT